VAGLTFVLAASPDPARAPAGPAGVRTAPPALQCRELSVRVWSETEPGKRMLEVGKDPGALPVCNGELLRVGVSLNQPAHVYLLWLDSAGVVTPLYPWNVGPRIREKELVFPPRLPPRAEVISPAAQKDYQGMGWVMGGKSGLDTILLLARRDPLPPAFQFTDALGEVPVALGLRDPREGAVRGGDEGRPLSQVVLDQQRAPEPEARVIDEPLLRMMNRLREHFPVVRAVRFAHEGRD
jgi:hypothetical protein